MVTAARLVVPRYPLNRYYYQMLQASVKNWYSPRTRYPLRALYQKQQAWSDETASALSRLYDHMMRLAEAVKEFDPNAQMSAINERTVTVSDEAAVKASARPQANVTSYQVEVYQLAAPQRNRGRFLERSGQTVVVGGVNRFQVKVGEREYTVSFFSFSDDTTEQSLYRMATAIQEERIGVHAAVEQQDGLIRLVLAGKTGAKNAFSLADVEGNCVRATGIGQVVETARNALFRVDGQFFEAADNTVKIGEKRDVELSLTAVTAKPVTVTVGVNPAAILHHVKQLIDRYHQLAAFLQNQQQLFVYHLPPLWKEWTVDERRMLAQVGIHLREDHPPVLDETRLLQVAAENFPLAAQVLSGTDGLAARIRRQLDRMLNQPSGMLSAATKGNSPYADFSLPGLFLRYASATGLFFNREF